MGIENVEVGNCPYCGGTEFEEGYQRGYAKIVTGAFDFGADNLYHIPLDMSLINNREFLGSYWFE